MILLILLILERGSSHIIGGSASDASLTNDSSCVTAATLLTGAPHNVIPPLTGGPPLNPGAPMMSEISGLHVVLYVCCPARTLCHEMVALGRILGHIARVQTVFEGPMGGSVTVHPPPPPTLRPPQRFTSMRAGKDWPTPGGRRGE